jgi:hypothetical protein
MFLTNRRGTATEEREKAISFPYFFGDIPAAERSFIGFKAYGPDWR